MRSTSTAFTIAAVVVGGGDVALMRSLSHAACRGGGGVITVVVAVERGFWKRCELGMSVLHQRCYRRKHPDARSPLLL